MFVFESDLSLFAILWVDAIHFVRHRHRVAHTDDFVATEGDLFVIVLTFGELANLFCFDIGFIHLSATVPATDEIDVFAFGIPLQ